MLQKEVLIGSKEVDISAKVYIKDMYIPAGVKEYLFGSSFENVRSFIIRNKSRSVITFHVNSPEKVNRIFTINDLCATVAETDDSFIRCAGKVLLQVHDVAGEYKMRGFVVSESENELKIELVGMVSSQRLDKYRWTPPPCTTKKG